MKKYFKNVIDKVRCMKAKAEAAEIRAAIQLRTAAARVSTQMQSETGTFVVEHGAVMLIILVIAAIAIALLKTLVTDTLAPTIKEKMLAFFN